MPFTPPALDLKDKPAKVRFTPPSISSKGKTIFKAPPISSKGVTTGIKLDPLQEAEFKAGQRPQGDDTDFIRSVAADPAGFLKSLPGDVLHVAGGIATLPYYTAADAVSKVTGDLEYGHNLARMETGNPNLPADEFLNNVAKTNPALATVGKIAKGVSQTVASLPLMGIGSLPAAAQKAVVAGFTADMLYHAPQAANTLYKEWEKPPGERDPAVITDNLRDVIQDVIFGGLGARSLRHTPAEIGAAMINKYVPRGQGISTNPAAPRTGRSLQMPKGVTLGQLKHPLAHVEARQVVPPSDESLRTETTEAIVARTKVGPERDKAFAERSAALKRVQASLQPGDVIIDADGNRREVSQVFKNGDIFVYGKDGDKTKEGQWTLNNEDVIERKGGGSNASKESSATGVPELEVRPPVGQMPPLRQQGQTAETRGEQAHAQTPEEENKLKLELQQRLVPAVQVTPGARPLTASADESSHDDILEKAGFDPKKIPHEDPRRGFVDPVTGRWYTRQEAEAATGIKGTAAAGGLDSQDLPRAKGKAESGKRKAETPPPSNQAAVEKAAPEATVSEDNAAKGVETAESNKLVELKAKAQAVKSGKVTGSLPSAATPRTYEVDSPEAIEAKRARMTAAGREASSSAKPTEDRPADWRPPRAETVAPVMSEGQNYGLRDAIKDAGGLSAPDLNTALREMRKGKTAAQVIGAWTNGGEADALGNILEEIHEASKSGEKAKYNDLRKAYQAAFAKSDAGGSDRVLDSLRDQADEGLFGDVPSDTSELYERAWHAAKQGPKVDREATAAAQAQADFEAFDKTLRVETAAQERGPTTIYSGSTKLGDVIISSRGNQIFMPTPEGERLPAEYQQQVLARAGIESAHIGEPDYVGMGGAVPSEFAPAESYVTSTKNAVTDQERVKRGLPAAMETARRAFGKVWDEAMGLVERAPEVQDQLVEELSHFPRAVNDTENALLLHRQITVQNDYAKTTQAMNQAFDDAKQFPDRRADAEELKLRAAKLSDDLLQLYDINKFVGTETARGLASRRMLSREDYSLAQMELSKRSANDGNSLTDDQRAEIQRLHDIIEQTQKEFDDYIKWSEQKLSEQNTTEAVGQIKQTLKDSGQGTDRPTDHLEGLEQQQRVTAGLKAARKSGRSLPDLARYIQKLVEAFVRQGVTERDPLIDEVHGVLKREINPNITRRETMDAISGYGDFKQLNPDEVKAKVRDLRGQMQQVAKLEDIEAKRPMQKTGLERRQPSDEERRLIKQVNEAKRRFGVVTTDPARQLKGALDAIKTRLKNQIADLDYQLSTRTKTLKTKTAVEYDQEANILKARRDELQKQFDEVFPRAPMTDAQRVQVAMKAVERDIALYEAKINAGDFLSKKQRSNAPTSFELEAQRARRDGLKAEFEELRNADAAWQARRDMAALHKSVAELQRRLDQNDLFQRRSTEPPPQTVEAQMVRAKRDMLRTQLTNLRNAAPETIAAREKAATESLEASIAELERRINEGDIEAKGLNALQVSSPRLEALRGERDDLLKVLRQLQAAARPKKSPEEIALNALKTRLRNATASYQERLAKGDFEPRVRQTVKLDDEAQKLKEANERAKNEFQRGLILDRLNNRKWYEKMADTFVKWRRGFLLSGPVTLAKLTSAAIQRLAITPAEELLGGAWSLALPKLAERAPREGGWNVDAESKAITDAFTRGMNDAGKVATTGQGGLDVLYGKGQEGGVRESEIEPRSVIDFFGRLHGALKAPVKRAEFARSFEKRIAWNIQQGVDVTDPLVQTRVALEAYKDAQRSIFLQDNRLMSAYKRALTAFEQKNKATGKVPASGKAAATVARTLLPIVRVPTNIVAETFQYAGGLVSGNAKLALALRRGIESLPPEEADQIMRHLKKGSLGAAVMLLGYFSPNAVGGYYQRGEKRGKTEVPAANVKLYGHNIPSWLLHNPLLETLQIGATVRRVADSKLRKKDANSQGITAGLVAGGLGLMEEVPFVREQMEVAKAFQPSERAGFFGELAKSLAIPELVQWLATTTDKTAAGETTARKPTSSWQHVETGVPGLRERVPEAIAPDVTTIAGYYMRFGRDANGRLLRDYPPAERDRVKEAVTNRLQGKVDAGQDLSQAALAVKLDDLKIEDAVAAWQAADEDSKRQFAPYLAKRLRKAAVDNRVDADTGVRLAKMLQPYLQPPEATNKQFKGFQP